MESKITASEASRNFSDILNRVKYKGEVFAVERNGEVVCKIVPAKAGSVAFTKKTGTIGDLVRFLKYGPKPDPGFWDDLEDIINNQPPMPPSPWERY